MAEAAWNSTTMGKSLRRVKAVFRNREDQGNIRTERKKQSVPNT
jgi:hypothetical protein